MDDLGLEIELVKEFERDGSQSSNYVDSARREIAYLLGWSRLCVVLRTTKVVGKRLMIDGIAFDISKELVDMVVKGGKMSFPVVYKKKNKDNKMKDVAFRVSLLYPDAYVGENHFVTGAERCTINKKQYRVRALTDLESVYKVIQLYNRQGDVTIDDILCESTELDKSINLTKNQLGETKCSLGVDILKSIEELNANYFSLINLLPEKFAMLEELKANYISMGNMLQEKFSIFEDLIKNIQVTVPDIKEQKKELPNNVIGVTFGNEDNGRVYLDKRFDNTRNEVNNFISLVLQKVDYFSNNSNGISKYKRVHEEMNTAGTELNKLMKEYIMANKKNCKDKTISVGTITTWCNRDYILENGVAVRKKNLKGVDDCLVEVDLDVDVK